MDSCYGQLTLTTREYMLDKEHKFQIICNKHSAAQTAVEQAKDVSPMFKVMKKLLRYMKNLKSCQSPIYKQILSTCKQKVYKELVRTHYGKSNISSER